MPRYLFLVHDEVDAARALAPDEMQAIVEAYGRWIRGLREAGHYVGGERLGDDGRTLRGDGARLRISDGPYVESKDLIAGFFMIEAPDYERAVELARDCPHLSRGVLEIREVMA